MSDRLNELRRQRALVQEHLAWIDAEIARENAAAPAMIAAPPSGNQLEAGAPHAQAVVPPAGDAADADAILERFSRSPSSMHQDVRKGCLLYFALALLFVAAVVGALYVFLPHKVPVPEAPRANAR